jgi:hypothetical protein
MLQSHSGFVIRWLNLAPFVLKRKGHIRKLGNPVDRSRDLRTGIFTARKGQHDRLVAAADLSCGLALSPVG